MSGRVSIMVLALGLALSGPVGASDVGYIYGRVETVDGDTYQGELRWGTEESFWDDIFNADKAENDNLEYLDRATLAHVRSRHWGGAWADMFGMEDPSLEHLFAIRFGDLKRIDVRHGDDVLAVFRNGQELKLHGGSNDVGAQITVVDPKVGIRELKWSRIRSIEFKDTPAKLQDKLGEPIYGTVKAGKYDFTGRIQWDNDECLSIDELDGDTRDGKVHIAFGDIAAIRKYRNGSLVTLKSGAEQYVTGTNDVNGENRGVVVVVPRLGSVKVGWNDFDEVTFRPAPNSGRGYDQFPNGRDLMGTVETRNGRYDGRIIYDIDEAWDFELLQGMNHDTEYLIPFRDIARIERKGLQRSEVQLRMGLTIELEDSHDVSRNNDGLLVFTGNRKPTYVDWRDITKVVFR